ncbi:putative ribonuclease H-like domain-containing protein [Tanacetum coccineum]
MTKINEEHGLISSVYKLRRTNHKDFQNCLFACFLSQKEPKKTLVDLPRDKWAIGTKWVFRNKKDERGIVMKNKDRLVAQGYTQEEGIDYDEVFAPVARIEAIRLFLAYSSFKGFVVYQMDVKGAFLYEKIEEEAPRAWYETLSTYLLDNGFHRVSGELLLLRLQDQQKSDGIFISQDKYVAEILKKFDFATVKTASTPIETNKDLVKNEEAIAVEVHLYRSMIGSLMYLTASRPDIMFAVCACSRFQVTLKTSHLHVVKRIFRYLNGQSKLGLWLSILSIWYCIERRLMMSICSQQLMKEHVGDEVVHKELGDKMERAATIASSLEVEQDSSGPRCEDNTFRSGEDSMLLIELMAHYTKLYALYALTENPTIYTSLIQQFGETASISTSENEEIEITAIIDGRVKTVTYESIRRHLKLEDAMGFSLTTFTCNFKQL